jgi:ribonuclease-3
MEAVLGAVFTDLGLDACRALTARLLGDEVSKLVDAGGIRRDAKSRLQELLQSRGTSPPAYEVVATEGPPHARSFIVRATISATGESPAIEARGEGRSKKVAEQAAAEVAIRELEALRGDAS